MIPVFSSISYDCHKYLMSVIMSLIRLNIIYYNNPMVRTFKSMSCLFNSSVVCISSERGYRDETIRNVSVRPSPLYHVPGIKLIVIQPTPQTYSWT